ncbi:MAG: cytochrome C [Planctomycetota bacterium]|nr:MAG: cytochrome C [Planctomycetota bacterium]REJ88228.1 MAG: cytochrome C [Planctomycetota bacterium]REK24498.1 MAG: cytochrome C [Planctomycetota bacterium]REK32459.1 MAG: cytochrome C [Planctomycetota bacterium]
MPQIFHPSMNTISRVSIFGAVFFVMAAVGVGAAIVRSPYATEVGVVRVQPVPFSHQHHVGDVGIDCRYCHRSVETEAFAGLPSTDVCMDCHSVLWADSPMLEPVRESYRTGEPLAWNRVHDLPDYAYFNHAIHVRQGVACETCHGRVDEMPLMYREETLHMQWCLECHRNPEVFLRPSEDVFAFDWEPDESTPTGEELAALHGIESKTDCSTCHR